jgi:DNA gyrase subunit B
MEEARRTEAGQEIYTADCIQVLKGLEAVRRRPGMYVGDTEDGSGLHHLVWEVLDNAIGEVLAGHAGRVTLTLSPGGAVTVEDDGRGIPVEIHPRAGVPFAEAVMSQLWAGHSEPGACKVSGGLHGVGVAVVNALSKRLELTVWRGGKEYFVAFAGDAPQVPLKAVGKAPDWTGTRIKFKPSPAIFSKTHFDYAKLEQRLQELAFLNPGARMMLADLRGAKPVCAEFLYRNGLVEFVKHLDRERTSLIAEPVHVKAVHGGIGVEAALCWNTGSEDNVLCYTNTVLQARGGAHLMGLRTALTRTIGTYAAASGIGLTRREVRQGLTCVLSVKVPNSVFRRPYPYWQRPGSHFQGPLRDRLVSPEVRLAVQDVMTGALRTWLTEHPHEAKLVLEKIAGARERIRDRRPKQLSEA